MFKQLTNILKWFTNLSDVKRIIAFMGATILFLAYFFIKRDSENTKAHQEFKIEYKKRLDTCDKHKSLLQNQVISWKDSFVNERLNNALKEIKAIKGVANKVKQSEKLILKETNIVKQKQKSIINKLSDDKE